MERPSSLCNRSCSFTDRSAAGVSDALSRTGCTARRTRCGPSGQGWRRTAPRPVGASTRVPGRIADGGGGLARPHLNHAVIALAEDDQVPASPHHSVITVAGKTRGGQPPACTRADHPRVVGEGQGTASTIGFVQRPSVGRHDGAARVGPGAEHPHVGEEDLRDAVPGRVYIGTPPRRRGGLDVLGLHGLRLRNTPTSAGRTGPAPGCRSLRPEHPHVGGEDGGGGPQGPSTGGTPPRRRGGRAVLGLDQLPGRNTPTSAGRTTAPL